MSTEGKNELVGAAGCASVGTAAGISGSVEEIWFNAV